MPHLRSNANLASATWKFFCPICGTDVPLGAYHSTVTQASTAADEFHLVTEMDFAKYVHRLARRRSALTAIQRPKALCCASWDTGQQSGRLLVIAVVLIVARAMWRVGTRFNLRQRDAIILKEKPPVLLLRSFANDTAGIPPSALRPGHPRLALFQDVDARDITLLRRKREQRVTVPCNAAVVIAPSPLRGRLAVLTTRKGANPLLQSKEVTPLLALL